MCKLFLRASAASVYMFIVNLVFNGGGQEYKCMIDVVKLYLRIEALFFYSFLLHNEMRRSKMILFLFIVRMMHRIKF